MTATINPKELAVQHSVRPEIGREFLTVQCPEGWDDVKKICHKVLTYDGKQFTFTGWNSDHNYACFARGLDGSWPKVATIG
jgi:hypothetical protein